MRNRCVHVLATLSFWTVLLVTSALGQEIKEGATIQFQWGPHQVQGVVSNSIAGRLIVRFDSVDQKGISTIIRAKNAKLYRVGDKLQAPRIKVGDYVRDDLGSGAGKVLELNGEMATVQLRLDGKPAEELLPIDSLKKQAAPEPSTNTSSSDSGSIRLWVDKTGKHKVEAIFAGVRDGTVQLRRPNSNKVIALPLSKLSDADQDFVAANDIRFVDFTPPKEMTAVTTCVSLNEKAAVLGYGSGYHPPISKLVILDLNSKTGSRIVNTSPLDEGTCQAISDNGKLLFTHHQKTDSFDPETKKKSVSWYLTIWDCSGAAVSSIREFKSTSLVGLPMAATWIDEQHLFYGRSTGDVKLIRIQDGQTKIVYSKKLGEPAMMRVFAISPNGKLFAVENGRKNQIEIYTTADCSLDRKVPTGGELLEDVALTNTMLLGATSSGQSVAWDLKKNELFGQAEKERSARRIQFGSGFGSLFPLSQEFGLLVHHPFRVARELTIYNFAKAESYRLIAPNVLDVGQNRRIWYPTNDGAGHHRYQAFSIPRDVTQTVTADSFQN